MFHSREEAVVHVAWDTSSAGMAEADVGLAVAVEVGAAGGDHAELSGEFGEVVDEAFAVVGVDDFDTVEALVGEGLDDGHELGVVFPSELGGVGEDGKAAGLVDQVNGLPGSGGFLVDVKAATLSEVSVEGVLDGGAEALADKDRGEVGPADGSALGFGEEFVFGDINARLGEQPDHGGVAAGAAFDEAAGEVFEGRGGHVHAVAEEVHGPGARKLAGDFDAGEEVDAGFCGGGGGLFAAADGVMVGERHRGKSCFGDLGDELAWGQSAVGGGGVHVEVDEIAHGGDGTKPPRRGCDDGGEILV